MRVTIVTETYPPEINGVTLHRRRRRGMRLSKESDLSRSPMRAAASSAVASLDPASVAVGFAELLDGLTLRRVA